LLSTVTRSEIGAGVEPEAAAPKSSDARSSEIESTALRSTATLADADALGPPGGGPPAQGWAAEAELCGAGAPVAKSAELTSVSVQPCPARMIALVALGAGAAPEPSKSAALP
jgi:hypothetical protein